MKQLYLLCFFLIYSTVAHAQITVVPGPDGSSAFGSTITVLANGNYVVTDPNWSNGVAMNVGAVYLYNGVTHALISTLTGSNASDQVGINGVVALTNGNYVVRSPYWSTASVFGVGAVTWGSGVTGVSGVVSASNSLVGSKESDAVGGDGVVALSNGNYVIISSDWDNASITDAGAVTWGNGTTGVSGAVSTSNSLVGTTANDKIGYNAVFALNGGNYVVGSPQWDNVSVSNAGAVTWGNGTTGVSGVISSSNSLVGSTAEDQVGFNSVIVLSNGNYVIASPFWNSASIIDAGAVTWGNGTTGVSGVVDLSNSLLGSTANDQVGSICVALSNGNYVVASPQWDNASISNVGAVTWGNGTTGVIGAVSISNSLVGSTTNDAVGGASVTPLSNGNYVVASTQWSNASLSRVGATTWGNGATGVSGEVSIANSLVGSTTDDMVGLVIALSNGNYVVASKNWDNGSTADVGAVTWGNGTIGVSGAVSISNSLVGSTASDAVGSEGVTALSNGNYVVISPNSDNTSINDAGAVTFGSGVAGVNGVLSISNSLMGSTASDKVGGGGVWALSNGNYVVASPEWDNASASDAGAVTWGNGTTGVSGVVSITNSLVGSTTDDEVGGVSALTNGNYVVFTSRWDNGPIADVGAVSWGNGATGISGVVSASNSLVGSTTNDLVGEFGVVAFSNGNYAVRSPFWQNASLVGVGAVTYASGKLAVSGEINSCNSVLGTEGYAGYTPINEFNAFYDYLLIGYRTGNFYAIHNGSQLAIDNTTLTETIDNEPVTFLSDCSPIGKVAPTGDANDVSGQVEMKVHVESTAPTATQPYVRRYYEISPADDANTATGRITLFYAQADFDDFNENRESAPALPTGPTDMDGVENLRITQNHGTSTTGVPGSYTGWTGSGPAVVLLNPEDEDILWNSAEKRWEVTFEVTGFSGFFAHSNVNGAALPVVLVSFSALKAESNALLQWKTSSEVNASHFEIERSVDGRKYISIGSITASASGNNELSYSFLDREFSSLAKIAYYRLRMVDADGSFAFSRVESVQPAAGQLSEYVYPNPARTGTTVTIKSTGEANDVQVLDLSGRTLNVRATQRFGTGFVVDQLPRGTYLIRFGTQRGSETRKLVVE